MVIYICSSITSVRLQQMFRRGMVRCVLEVSVVFIRTCSSLILWAGAAMRLGTISGLQAGDGGKRGGQGASKGWGD